jgi:hypothetical protein
VVRDRGDARQRVRSECGSCAAGEAAARSERPGAAGSQRPGSGPGRRASKGGIRSVAARTGKQRRDIQVTTDWRPLYFAWPKGVSPAPFELRVDKASLKVAPSSYAEKDQPLYAKAFDAVLPEAVRHANELRAQALRPKR